MLWTVSTPHYSPRLAMLKNIVIIFIGLKFGFSRHLYLRYLGSLLIDIIKRRKHRITLF